MCVIVAPFGPELSLPGYSTARSECILYRFCLSVKAYGQLEEIGGVIMIDCEYLELVGKGGGGRKAASRLLQVVT